MGGTPCICCGNVKSCTYCEKVWWSLKKLKIELSYDPAFPLWSTNTKEMKISDQKNPSVFVSHSVVSDFFWPHGLVRLLCPWNSPGKNTGVGCHSLLEGIFPTQGSNPGLLHCRQILYHLSYQGSPLYVYVQSSIFHNTQKIEAIQMFIKGLTDKWDMVYLYDGILFSHEEKQNTNISYNMNEPWKHDVKWRKTNTKGHIWYNFLSVKYPD